MDPFSLPLLALRYLPYALCLLLSGACLRLVFTVRCSSSLLCILWSACSLIPTACFLLYDLYLITHFFEILPLASQIEVVQEVFRGV
jgi:hypothetical protein